MAQPTVTELLTQVRNNLDEATAAQWTDDMLGRWINEGARDLARSTRYLKGSFSQAVTGGTGTYPLNANIISVEHVYWTSDADTSRKTPLEPKHFENMDSIWGEWQNRESANPQFYAVMGMQPANLYLWPIPEGDGDLDIIASRLYTAIAIPVVGAATADVPEIWYDAITDYVEHKALLRDGQDERSMARHQMYTTKREALTQNADYLAQNREVTPAPGTAAGYLPNWLVEPGFWY